MNMIQVSWENLFIMTGNFIPLVLVIFGLNTCIGGDLLITPILTFVDYVWTLPRALTPTRGPFLGRVNKDLHRYAKKK